MGCQNLLNNLLQGSGTHLRRHVPGTTDLGWMGDHSNHSDPAKGFDWSFEEMSQFYACVYWQWAERSKESACLAVKRLQAESSRPWDVMMMLFNELYTMSVPLFVPDKHWVVQAPGRKLGASLLSMVAWCLQMCLRSVPCCGPWNLSQETGGTWEPRTWGLKKHRTLTLMSAWMTWIFRTETTFICIHQKAHNYTYTIKIILHA